MIFYITSFLKTNEAINTAASTYAKKEKFIVNEPPVCIGRACHAFFNVVPDSNVRQDMIE